MRGRDMRATLTLGSAAGKLYSSGDPSRLQ
jgi:hypothetical protein